MEEKPLATFRRFAIPAAAAIILVASLALLFHSLREYRYADIIARVRGYSRGTILAALAVTALSFLELTLYDVLALRYIGERMPYRKTAFVSFLGYVFNLNIGMSILGSSAIRMRFYSLWGLESGKIARIIVFCVATFWVGLAAAGGTALLVAPTAVPAGFALSARIVGWLLIAAALGYVVACATGKASVTFRSFTIALPPARIAVAQFAVAVMDWCLAAGALYILLPGERPPFTNFIAVFMVAQLAAATSHVPGGIGVLETVLMISLSSYADPGPLFGAFLAYRAIYYLCPLAAAALAFTAHEAWVRRKQAEGIVAAAARMAEPIVPALISASVFIAGATLLFSAATPSIAARMKRLQEFLPLALLESSHFAASLAGLALLFVADALRRRVDAAYYIAVGLLSAGAAFSILKGLEWEQAALLCVVLLMLGFSRKAFYRRAVVLSRPDGPVWLAAAGTVIAVSVWLGFFAHKHVQYRTELWWQFEASRDAPRALRAALGIALGAGAVALRILLEPKPALPSLAFTECEGDVRRILAAASEPSANLALLGDKKFYFDADRKAFVMYALTGRTCVVMGDPVGDREVFPDLLWDFYETVRRQGGRIVWYEISAAHLSRYVELGLRIFKIGEEAVVDLPDFTLAGSRGKRLRPPCNKLEKEGYAFSVLPPEETALRMEEIRNISDSWLAEKKAKEKGFSLGFFDEGYLSNFRTAVVTREGRIAAFASLWLSGDGSSAAVDLMRHAAGVPNGTMEFLFVRSIEWAKDSGCREFSLGIAPFSGIDPRQAAPLWNKAIALIFKNGEGIYNFQGLRAFKEKFAPRWEPRYIAAGSGTPLANAAADIALTVSRGKREAESTTP